MDEINYENFVKQAETDLAKVRLRGFVLVKAMVEAEDDGELYGADFFYAGLVDKSSFLLDGVKCCVKEKNLIVLGILLRTQIDSCLRAFALTLVDEPHTFAIRILEGEILRKMVDKNGNKMTDRYLRDKMSEIDNKINPVYEAACGYVHFSDKGMRHTLKADENNPLQISITVGEKREEDLIIIREGYRAFLYFTRFLYENGLQSWIAIKTKVGRAKRGINETRI